MADFKTIETQEQLNEVIKDRLVREREAVKKEYEEKYKDYEDLKTRATGFDDEKKNLEDTILQGKADLDKLQTENKRLTGEALKVKIALQNGIPFEMAAKLSGDDEESLNKDAQNMAKYMQGNKPPLRNPESKSAEAGETAYKNLVKGLHIDD